MVVVTLPDRSKREYPAPLTVFEVAQSIGAGLAKVAEPLGYIGEGVTLKINTLTQAQLNWFFRGWPEVVRFYPEIMGDACVRGKQRCTCN